MRSSTVRSIRCFQWELEIRTPTAKSAKGPRRQGDISPPSRRQISVTVSTVAACPRWSTLPRRLRSCVASPQSSEPPRAIAARIERCCCIHIASGDDSQASSSAPNLSIIWAIHESAQTTARLGPRNIPTAIFPAPATIGQLRLFTRPHVRAAVSAVGGSPASSLNPTARNSSAALPQLMPVVSAIAAILAR